MFQLKTFIAAALLFEISLCCGLLLLMAGIAGGFFRRCNLLQLKTCLGAFDDINDTLVRSII